jgi:hypothetical protein
MGGARAIRGVVHNFLSTYVSRYSAQDGYWLFGFLVPQLTTMRCDLLSPLLEVRPHVRRAIDLARTKFYDQARKGKVDVGLVRRVELTLSRAEHSVASQVNGHSTQAWPVTVAVDVELLTGKHHRVERVIVVAPHNPTAEYRSRS